MDQTRTLFFQLGLVLIPALTVLVVDQVTKGLVREHLSRGRSIEIAGGLIRFDLTRNTGAAFGLFKAAGYWLAIIAVAVGIGAILFHRRIARMPLLVRLAVGLVAGGALGNLVDRLRFGYVVDFIDLKWWYVFNVADSAIVCGAAALLIQSAMTRRPGDP